MRSLLNSEGNLSPCVSAIWSDIVSLIGSESESESGSGGRSAFDAVDVRTGCSVADAVSRRCDHYLACPR
jgi:hypothetical protein